MRTHTPAHKETERERDRQREREQHRVRRERESTHCVREKEREHTHILGANVCSLTQANRLCAHRPPPADFPLRWRCLRTCSSACYASFPRRCARRTTGVSAARGTWPGFSEAGGDPTPGKGLQPASIFFCSQRLPAVLRACPLKGSWVGSSTPGGTEIMAFLRGVWVFGPNFISKPLTWPVLDFVLLCLGVPAGPDRQLEPPPPQTSRGIQPAPFFPAGLRDPLGAPQENPGTRRPAQSGPCASRRRPPPPAPSAPRPATSAALDVAGVGGAMRCSGGSTCR